MIVAVHQPNLFPRLKVIQKLLLADTWVVLDDVQFANREYQNRALLLPDHGQPKPFWFTVPISRPNGRSSRISELRFAPNTNYGSHISQVISSTYRKTDEFKRWWLTACPRLFEAGTVDTPAALFLRSALLLCEAAGRVPPVVHSSEFDLPTGMAKSERLARLVKLAGGDTFIADSGATQYLDEGPFAAYEVRILWHAWRNSDPYVHAGALAPILRNGSGLNVLARSVDLYTEWTQLSRISRFRAQATAAAEG